MNKDRLKLIENDTKKFGIHSRRLHFHPADLLSR